MQIDKRSFLKLAAGQTAFIGVGAAFIALGVVFLGKSRQDG